MEGPILLYNSKGNFMGWGVFFSQQERSGEMHGELGALWGLTSDGMA